MRTHRAGTWLFLRVLGAVYLSAFVSFGVQARGLVGRDGILPFVELQDAAWARFGAGAIWRWPSLLWLFPSDGALVALCVAGAVLAVLLLLDVAPLVTAALLWAGYLSISSMGGEFLGYQWDALLLETGLAAILVAPLRLAPGFGRDRPPSRLAVLVLGFLLFRLMFASGWVKLASGDEAWRRLTAMTYHYWTQPLPVWTSWFADRLPARVHAAEELVMLVIELVVPFLLVLRAGRHVAAALFVLLQAGIAATGNYGFFNVLSAALVLPLLDDDLLARIPAVARRLSGTAPPWTLPAALGRVAVWDASFCLLALGSFMLLAQVTRQPLPEGARAALGAAGSLQAVNGYGLFAVMTRDRPEILLEGAGEDGVWHAYELRWKPGDPARRPRFAPLHMPRLDWQMWFAALPLSRHGGLSPREACESTEWLLRFQRRLLQGSPQVKSLLANDPFPDAPPVAVRSTVWDYRFADPGDAAWWKREERGPYCPALRLDETGRLVAAE